MTKTINGLTVTSSAASGDFIPIWRAANGDTRKITKSNFIGATLTGLGTLATGGFTGTLPATGTIAIRGVIVGARVYNNAAISIANNSHTVVTFNSERYDTDNLHSTGGNTGRLIAPVTGKYLITAHIAFDANATGVRMIYLRVNGSTNIASQTINANTVGNNLSIVSVYELNAADYVEITVYQNSGGALNVLAAASLSPEFALTLLSS